jgi:ATP-dependent DNA ligase
MEAEPVDDLPGGKGWLYEPKYDGFRCIAFRDGGEVRLQSKNQKPLDRYFPEVADGLQGLRADGSSSTGRSSFSTDRSRRCN